MQKYNNIINAVHGKVERNIIGYVNTLKTLYMLHIYVCMRVDGYGRQNRFVRCLATAIKLHSIDTVGFTKSVCNKCT